ncbi:MAG TPA: DUF3300 domain-containing protein [Candidatus Aquilonibacter sp.]|nr:DUF3300 domain-containing protein [Candidatus Aquilonibacter sp.]
MNWRRGSSNDSTIARNLSGASQPGVGRRILTYFLVFAFLSSVWPHDLGAATSAQDQATQGAPQQATQQAPPSPDQSNNPAPPYTQQTPEQLQQLVAPIALYPDSLVAQILAASTFPEEVVEADRWVQAHPDLKGKDLGDAVDQQPWDPSVKALTAFPSVLANMDKNLSWTSSLGDAYYNQPEDVTDAVQFMRHKAKDAGKLDSTSQEKVKTDGDTIIIEPAEPDVVYVPAYDPWLVYGYPLLPWPGWYEYPGIWYAGPDLFWFGAGFSIGFFGGFGWGWNHWGFDWRHHWVNFDHDHYFSRSRTFYNRDAFYRGGSRGGVYNHPGGISRPFEGDNRAARGFGESRGRSGLNTGAFSNYDHGGESRDYSARGRSSFGGGGFGGGGGGFHGGGGGGFHGGGGRHR